MKNKKGFLNPKKYSRVKKAERLELAILLKRGYTLKDISQAMKRSISTISSEIKNNSVRGVYNPLKAQHKAYVRRKYSRFQMMKIIKNKSLWDYIEDKLKKGWSPETISGRIKNIDQYVETISSKSIYKFIKNRYLEKYLKLKGRKRKRGRKKVKITNRVFIDQRSKNIDKRRVYGHWEGDFIVSGKSGKGVLLVLLERKTRYVIIKKLMNIDTKTVNDSIFEMLEFVRCLSLTLDNDISFQKHVELSKMIKAPVYFCNPYHSWEKGGVESINGLIREYIPKGCDISKYSKDRLQEIERSLNDRPRKCLKFKTSFEIMAEKNLFED